MNEQFQNNEPFDRREARRQRREERREALGVSGGSTWVVGLILIILGGAFLMQNIGIFNIPFTNWWALFILIPAFGSLDRAYRAYKQAGESIYRICSQLIIRWVDPHHGGWDVPLQSQLDVLWSHHTHSGGRRNSGHQYACYKGIGTLHCFDMSYLWNVHVRRRVACLRIGQRKPLQGFDPK